MPTRIHEVYTSRELVLTASSASRGSKPSKADHVRFNQPGTRASLSISGQIMTLWFLSQNRQAAGSNPARDKNYDPSIFVAWLTFLCRAVACWHGENPC